MISRRNFLKGIAVAPVVASLPAVAKPQPIKEKEVAQYYKPIPQGQFGIQKVLVASAYEVTLSIQTKYKERNLLTGDVVTHVNSWMYKIPALGVVLEPMFVVPVNEITKITVRNENGMTIYLEPKYNKVLGKFEDIMIQNIT